MTTDEQQKLSPAEFAAKIKAQYPDYASVPDDELAQRMIAKFPSYRSIVEMPDTAAPSSPPTPSDSGAVIPAGAALAVPAVARGAMEVATNPAVPRVAASVGRVIGGAAPVIGGGAELGPAGALLGMGQVAKGAWAGGKAGWFTGKLAQDVAAPVARAAEVLAPYAQAISTVSGAQGVLDLAQMADKTRKDIGTLGFSLETPRSDADKAANPTLVTAVASKISDLASSLAKNGVEAPVAHAIKLISDGSSTAFGKLMSLYMSAK